MTELQTLKAVYPLGIVLATMAARTKRRFLVFFLLVFPMLLLFALYVGADWKACCGLVAAICWLISKTLLPQGSKSPLEGIISDGLAAVLGSKTHGERGGEGVSSGQSRHSVERT